MGKAIFAVLLLLFVNFSISAQSENRISGTVYDKSSKEPVGQAGIRILNAKDSTYVTGTATSNSGKFVVNARPGQYIINITFLGYSPLFIDVNTQNKPAALGDIFLREDGIMLSEAVVTAKAIEIAVKGDTIEYNADSYKVQESAVVEDLLKKMPGAEVDSEGKITINGKEIKKILVDGKEFFSSDPKMASKNLPAAMIDKLQVLDRKSDMALMTGFDDGEEETVINLTVKKGMKQGLFGNVTGGYGSKDRYGVSGIVNYMHDDNQFTFIGGSNNTNNEGFSDNAGGSFRGLRGGRGLNFGGINGISESTNGGLNFAITSSPQLKWGGNVRYGSTDNDVKSSSYTEEYRPNDSKGNQFREENSIGSSNSDNISADLRFEWTPDSLTRIIFSPKIEYGKNRTNEVSEFLTRYATDSINWGSSMNSTDGNTGSASAKLDISRELGKKGRVLSFSFSGGFSKLDNDGFSWSKTMFKREVADSTSIIDRKFNQQNKSHNWRGYVSYVEPIGRNNYIQLNYSYRKNYSESDKETYNLDNAGIYSVIDTSATKKLENNFINQEIGLNFKAIRAKYNYTVGVALQPSSSESWTITPSERSVVKNDVLNFSPVAQFNYLWSKRHNLRLDYNGTTGQPSATQLSNVRDDSNPMNVTYGNPNLKPSFSNRFRIRLQNFNPEQASAFMLFGGLNFSSNDIVQKTYLLDDGKKETTYDNINGNWNASVRAIMNKPLRNKKFSVNSMTYVAYSESNGYINSDKNTAATSSFSEHLGVRFQSDIFQNSYENGSLEFSLRGNFNYTNTSNSMPGQEDYRVYKYGGTFSTSIYLPWSVSIDSDITYTANSGDRLRYDQKEWMWNATASKDFPIKVKGKSYGTGAIKLSVYDILQQRSNISQSVRTDSYSETVTNTIPTYFMASFVYKFQIFKGGARMTDMDQGREFRGGPRFGPGRPPR